jgi:hypothetical protein
LANYYLLTGRERFSLLLPLLLLPSHLFFLSPMLAALFPGLFLDAPGFRVDQRT